MLAMESLVYENSPLAEYLQSKIIISFSMNMSWNMQLISRNNLGEGEGDSNWATLEPEPGNDGSYSNRDFAPRGPSRFQEHVRRKMPTPFDLCKSGRKTIFTKFYDAFSV